MSDFEITGRYAANLPHCLFTPGEEYGYDTLGPDQWGQVLGDFAEGALVLIGSRPDILATLRAAVADVEDSYRAEHENGYHLPESAPETMPADHYVELISAALEIHRPRHSPTHGQVCVECSRSARVPYPCPTAKALGVRT